VLGPGIAIVDSAATTAEALAVRLSAAGGLRPAGAAGTLALRATDGPERFARVSRTFGLDVAASDVELVDLGGA
jgi:glutamate racemase